MTREEGSKKTRAYLKNRIEQIRKALDLAERNLEEREEIRYTKVELLVANGFLPLALEYCARIEELEMEYDND